MERATRLFLCVALAVLSMTALGCGKKAGPVAPELLPPPQVINLSVEKTKGLARLFWETDKSRKSGPVDKYLIFVHQEAQDAPFCKDCPLSFSQAGEAPADKKESWFVFSLEPNIRYGIRVAAKGPGGLGPVSEVVWVQK